MPYRDPCATALPQAGSPLLFVSLVSGVCSHITGSQYRRVWNTEFSAEWPVGHTDTQRDRGSETQVLLFVVVPWNVGAKNQYVL